MTKIITYHTDGTLPSKKEIFVFGSNLAGRHGAGAARIAAQQFGAKYGVGCGITGMSYAVPTKGEKLEVLNATIISKHISDFVEYAKQHGEQKFFITRIGCGLAGYKDAEIAPMFKDAPGNCNFPIQWQKFLSGEKNGR